MLKLYENIKIRRQELKMSQEELAKKTGYSGKSMIAHIEKGDVDLPQSKILLIAEALDILPGELMGWDSDLLDSSAAALSDPEQKLVDNYRQLNPEGQEKLIEYSEDLVSLGKYKKSDLAEVVEETA